MSVAEQNQITVPYVYQADLSDAEPDFDYVLKAAGGTYPLTLYTPETRAAARAAHPTLASITDEQLTHFCETVPMPAGSVCRVSVAAVPRDPAKPGFVHLVAITCVPKATAQTVLSQTIDYPSTAAAFLFHHPDLMTDTGDIAAIVMEHLSPDTAPAAYKDILALALEMKRQGVPTEDPKKGWAQLLPFEGANNTTLVQQQPSARTIAAAQPAMMRIQVTTKNDLRLANRKWSPQQGVSVVAGTPPSQPEPSAFIDSDFRIKPDVTASVYGLQTSAGPPSTPGKGNRASLWMTNYYLRWLGAYITFLDVNGVPLKTPNWSPDGAGPAPIYIYQEDTLRWLGPLPTAGTLLGAPAFPATLKIDITFPEDAAAARVYGIGLGTGENPFPLAELYGTARTLFGNLIIPVLLLGVAVDQRPGGILAEILQDPFVSLALKVGGAIFAGDVFVGSAVNRKLDVKGLATIGQFLINKGAGEGLGRLAKFVAEKLTEEEIEDAAPFVGWALAAINVLENVAQITQTIVEVATTPLVIPNRVAATVTSTVTILPDPRKQAFPGSSSTKARSYNVRLVYQGNGPTMSVTTPVGTGSTETQLTAKLTNNLGGLVKIQCDFFLGTEIAASASTAWLPNTEANTGSVTLALFETPVELNEDSVYTHESLLTFQDGAYVWMPTQQAPTSTRASLSAATGVGVNAISELGRVHLSQRHHQLGYSWEAAGLGLADCSNENAGRTDAQLYALQSVDIPGLPMSDGRFSGCGYSPRTTILYDPYPPRFLMENGQFVIGPDKRPVADPKDLDLGLYYIDPSARLLPDDRGGGYHLRQIPNEGTAPINSSAPAPSFGRFPLQVDAAVIHPSGRVLAINKQDSVLMVTPLETDGRADNDVPFARKLGGPAIDYLTPGGNATDRRRPGLLAAPVAIASTYDGTVLVLENAVDTPAVSRIQAFDGNGNPVDTFPDGPGKRSPFLALPTGRSYLDLAVVGNKDLAYLYILHYAGDGRDPRNYSVDIYRIGDTVPQDSKQPLVTTPGVSAAGLAVDLFRTLYTLNWSMTTDGHGNDAGPSGPKTGSKGRTVPSLSQWLPPGGRA